MSPLHRKNILCLERATLIVHALGVLGMFVEVVQHERSMPSLMSHPSTFLRHTSLFSLPTGHTQMYVQVVFALTGSRRLQEENP